MVTQRADSDRRVQRFAALVHLNSDSDQSTWQEWPRGSSFAPTVGCDGMPSPRASAGAGVPGQCIQALARIVGFGTELATDRGAGQKGLLRSATMNPRKTTLMIAALMASTLSTAALAEGQAKSETGRLIAQQGNEALAQIRYDMLQSLEARFQGTPATVQRVRYTAPRREQTSSNAS